MGGDRGVGVGGRRRGREAGERDRGGGGRRDEPRFYVVPRVVLGDLSARGSSDGNGDDSRI